MTKDKNYLKHYGILGMRWGHRKSPENLSKSSSKGVNVVEENRRILKKNPNAAVVNWDAIKKKEDLTSNEKSEDRVERNRKIRNAAIGIGLGLGVAAGAYLYATHKKEVDAALKRALDKVGNKKISELSKEDIQKYRKIGLKGIDTKEEAINANWVASWIYHDKHRYDAISDEAFDALDTNDISLKPGQILKRITKDKNSILGDNSFISFDEDDNNRYAAFLPAMWKTNYHLNAKPDIYQMSMKALEEIKAPSSKKSVQILADLIEKHPVLKVGVADLGEGNLDSLSFAKKYYHRVATGFINRDSTLTKKYFEEVRRLGYNALIDDNDAGRLARTPLILLNSKAVLHEGTKPLSQKDIREILSKIKPMAGEDLTVTDEIGRLQKEYKSLGFLEKLMQVSPQLAVQIYYKALYLN